MATDLLIPHTTRNSEEPGPSLCRHMWKWNNASKLKDLYIYMDVYIYIYIYTHRYRENVCGVDMCLRSKCVDDKRTPLSSSAAGPSLKTLRPTAYTEHTSTDLEGESTALGEAPDPLERRSSWAECFLVLNVADWAGSETSNPSTSFPHTSKTRLWCHLMLQQTYD